MFGAQIATRSPGSTPDAISARAAASTVVGELGEGQAHVAVDEAFEVAEALGGAAHDSRDRQRQLHRRDATAASVVEDDGATVSRNAARNL